jgi:hypothetical protein
LARKRTFPEETSLTQYADRGFLAILGDNGESYLACLQIKHRVRWISLREDGLLLWEERGLPAFSDGGEECLGVELATIVGARRWTRRIPLALRFLFSRRRDGGFR